MRVAAAAGPPAFARPQRPSSADAPADAISSPGDAPSSNRRGSQVPLMHALHQGNGQKTGIKRRFAEEILAQQAAAGLGDASAADDGATTSAPGPVGSEPVLTEPVVSDPVSGLNSEPVADATIPPDGRGSGRETIVLDGTGFGVDLAVPADVYDPLDELREAVEESSDGPVEELQQLLAEEIAAALEDDREQIDVHRV